MTRKDVLSKLAEHRRELRDRFGVESLALFGSVAHDKATDASDVDLLVDFDRPTGYFGLIALQDRLQEMLGCPVDVGTRDALKPRFRDRVEKECIHVP